jgi:hypothetical protein
MLAALGTTLPATAQQLLAVVSQRPVAAASFGVFGLRENEDSSAVLEVEYRFAPRRWGLRPVVGAAATTTGASYLRLGAGRDFHLADRWIAHLGVAGSSYFEGSAKELGSTLEFRSTFELYYRLRDDFDLGISLAHLSNSGIGDINPGVETLGITFAWRQPLVRRAAPRDWR